MRKCKLRQAAAGRQRPRLRQAAAGHVPNPSLQGLGFNAYPRDSTLASLLSFFCLPSPPSEVALDSDMATMDVSGDLRALIHSDALCKISLTCVFDH